MYQGVNERTGERTVSCFDEEDLIEILESTDSGDLWDVYRDGRLAFYWSRPERRI